MLKQIKTALILALAVPLLVGCYLPVRFDAEIELGRTGFYDIEFDGYMAALPLYTDLQAGKLGEAEAAEKIANTVADFRNDTATQEAEYVRDGLFRVRWKRDGDLLKSKMVTFLRRNEKIFTLKYLKDQGRMVLEGVSITSENVRRIQDAGLDSQGQLRLRTDARVIDHNATAVKDVKGDNRTKVYIWDIKTLTDPSPYLAAVLR